MGLQFSSLWPFKRAPEEFPIFDQYVTLTDTDIANITMGIQPPSTVTWIEGEVDVKLMKERVKAIVSANPFLAGNFVKDSSGQIKWGYNNLDKDNLDKVVTDKMIQVVEDNPQLGKYQEGETASYTKLMELAEPYLLETGAADLKGQPIWKVVIIKPCVVIVTMSHAAGDGATYYHFFQMLLTGKVETLPVERVFFGEEEKTKLMGYQEARLLSQWGYIFILGFIWTFLIAPWWPFAEQTTAEFLLADKERIQDIKESAAGDNSKAGIPFVSTNDILTSWFFSNANLPHGTMIIDMRSRLKGLAPGMVGNYQDILYYRQEDTTSPQLVRKSVINMKRAVTPDRPIRLLEMAFSSMAIIDNWAGFVSLGAAVGIKVKQHLPVARLDLWPATAALAIVFEARPGQLGVFLIGTPSKLKGLVEALPAPFQNPAEGPFMTV